MGVTMALTTVILGLSIIGPSLACWSREKSSDEPVPACCLNVSSPSAKMSSPSGNNSSARGDMGRPKTRTKEGEGRAEEDGEAGDKEEAELKRKRKLDNPQARPGFIDMANTTFLGDNNDTRQDEAIQDLMITA